MKTQTVSYISLSDVFEGLPFAHNEFDCSDPKCSFGDNALTLVKPNIVIEALKTQCEENDELDDESRKQVDIAIERLEYIKTMNTDYIDMES